MDLLTFLLSFVPGVLLRRFFPESKLANKIEVTVCDDRRGVFLNGEDIPYAQVNLKVTNLTPFEITIERLWCEIRFIGGRVAKLESTLRQSVDSRSHTHFHMEAIMTAPQRDFLKCISPSDLEKYRSERQLRIGLDGELSCGVRRVQIFGKKGVSNCLERLVIKPTDNAMVVRT